MRIVMMGTGTFAEPTFQALLNAGESVVGLITQPDREVGRRTGGSRQVGVGMANLAAAANVPIAQPQSINTPDGLAQLIAMQPDLLVVAAYGQILKPSVIAAAPLGAINVHASLLPKYRGASPIAHAILAGETVSGVTIIRITPGLDAGNMLAQEELAIMPDETAGELELRLAPLGARLALAVVQQQKVGDVVGVKQDEQLVTRAPKLTKEMGLIDWSQSAERIACQVRAMQPWPTAYTFFHRPGKDPMRLIVNRLGARSRSDGAPGSLTTAVGAGLHICCGHGETIEVTELQPAGKKRMGAIEFLRGYPVQANYRFGAEL